MLKLLQYCNYIIIVMQIKLMLLHDPRVHGKFLAMLDPYNQGPYILEYYPIFTPVCMALELLYMIPEYMVSSWLC